MAFKQKVEDHPVFAVSGLVIAAFLGGMGVLSFLDSREENLKEDIIRTLKNDIQKLSDQNKDILRQLVDQRIETAKIRGEINQSSANRIKSESDKILNNISEDDLINKNIVGGADSFIRNPLGGLKF